MPFGRRSSAITFSSDSLIYFGLGYNGSNFYDDLWSYNPTSSTWTQLSSFPGNKRFEASYFKIDSNTVIVGGGTGQSSSSPFNDYYIYDIKNDTWTQTTSFIDGARSRGAYFAINGKGYISTGRSSSANLNDTWEYTPKNYSFLAYDSVLCFGDSILFDASTANATYLWQDNSTNSTFYGKTSGLYWVEIDVNGCKRVDSFNLKVNPKIKLNLGNDTNLCPDESFLLDATLAGATYTWNDNSKASKLKIFSPGIYWVDLKLNGCVKRDSITITYTSQQNLNLGNDTTLCHDGTLLLDATTNSSTYLWQDGSTNSTFLVNDSGLYRVTVQNNCSILNDSIYISTKNCNCELQIPNVITPNRDNVNDYFHVLSPCEFSAFNLKIFNRWGELLISYNNSVLLWDGTVNGFNVEEGVYFYTLEFKEEGATKMRKKAGNFTLLR